MAEGMMRTDTHAQNILGQFDNARQLLGWELMIYCDDKHWHVMGSTQTGLAAMARCLITDCR